MKGNANDARRLKVYVHKTNKGGAEILFLHREYKR